MQSAVVKDAISRVPADSEGGELFKSLGLTGQPLSEAAKDALAKDALAKEAAAVEAAKELGREKRMQRQIKKDLAKAQAEFEKANENERLLDKQHRQKLKRERQKKEKKAALKITTHMKAILKGRATREML